MHLSHQEHLTLQMEFLINHTLKDIVFVGMNAHSQNFMELLEKTIVKTDKWSYNHNISLFMVEHCSDDEFERVRKHITKDGYSIPEEYEYVITYPYELNQGFEMSSIQTSDDEQEYRWSGWDEPGATCDV